CRSTRCENLSSYTQLAASELWSWGTSPRYLCGLHVCAILQHERYRVASARFRRVDLSASCRGDRRSIEEKWPTLGDRCAGAQEHPHPKATIRFHVLQASK